MDSADRAARHVPHEAAVACGLRVGQQALVFTDTPTLSQPEILVYRAGEKFDESGHLTHEKTREYVSRLLQRVADWTRTLRA